MVAKVQKWGNSLGLRLPSKLAQELSVHAGTEVDIRVVRGRIVITPIHSKTYRLDELLSDVRPSNLHREEPVGASRGGEAW